MLKKKKKKKQVFHGILDLGTYKHEKKKNKNTSLQQRDHDPGHHLSTFGKLMSYAWGRSHSVKKRLPSPVFKPYSGDSFYFFVLTEPGQSSDNKASSVSRSNGGHVRSKWLQSRVSRRPPPCHFQTTTPSLPSWSSPPGSLCSLPCARLHLASGHASSTDVSVVSLPIPLCSDSIHQPT